METRFIYSLKRIYLISELQIINNLHKYIIDSQGQDNGKY